MKHLTSDQSCWECPSWWQTPQLRPVLEARRRSDGLGRQFCQPVLSHLASVVSWLLVSQAPLTDHLSIRLRWRSCRSAHTRRSHILCQSPDRPIEIPQTPLHAQTLLTRLRNAGTKPSVRPVQVRGRAAVAAFDVYVLANQLTPASRRGSGRGARGGTTSRDRPDTA